MSKFRLKAKNLEINKVMEESDDNVSQLSTAYNASKIMQGKRGSMIVLPNDTMRMTGDDFNNFGAQSMSK